MMSIPMSWCRLARVFQSQYLLLLMLALVLFVLLNNVANDDLRPYNSKLKLHSLHLRSHVPGMKGYLVWSKGCKMPNLDPYLPEVTRHFKRMKYEPCQSKPPLSRVIYNNTINKYILLIDPNATSAYGPMKHLNCCYQNIERNATGINADRIVSLSKCQEFHGNISLEATSDNILVKCSIQGKQVYINGHAMMPERPEIRQRLNSWKSYDQLVSKTKTKPPSVLMIGIDSISRTHLIRAMPQTTQYLYDNDWFELSGFNKIGDNTFPNLMAILTGLNNTTALRRCKPTVLNGLDNCNFIWNTYRRYGYVTAYAEDEASISTFNYMKMGFEQPPTDYYLRPFLLTAEKYLPIVTRSRLTYCLGYQHSADYIYQYAIELSTRYQNDTYFGLFWSNTFSHNAISDCTSMDDHIVHYLKRFSNLGTLDNAIVVFFSDHGIRYGPTRKTYSGHLEERLPFMYIWLPAYLRRQHASLVSALSVNRNRLTNPYDLHMTLKHILALTGRLPNAQYQSLNHSDACKQCQSLFEAVPINRTCNDAAIEAHWCACLNYQSIYKNSKNVIQLANLLIDYINEFVYNYQNHSLIRFCTPLKLAYIVSAYRIQQSMQYQYEDASDNTREVYRLIFYTKPNNGLFEATCIYSPISGYLHVSGEISRLNSYQKDSECVGEGSAKKYCSCYKPF